MVLGLVVPLVLKLADLNLDLPVNSHWTEEDLEPFVFLSIVTMNIWELWTRHVYVCTTLLSVIFVERSSTSIMPTTCAQ
jgi:predicted cation transporter